MNKLRMGVIGAGLWGGNHAHTFNVLPETELVGVCDLDEGRALKMKEAYRATQAFTDYQKLISSDQIDAISVATPDFTHTPIILAALKADKHVLSEKTACDDSARSRGNCCGRRKVQGQADD